MCRKQVVLTVLPCAATCATLFGETQAQLVKLSAVLLAVANCHPGDHQRPSPGYGDLLRRLTDNPPPAPACPVDSTQTSAPVWNGEAWS